MKGVTLESSTIVDGTPEWAQETLDTYRKVEHQRTLVAAHVLKLGILMEQGEYLKGHCAVAMVGDGSEARMANGQHSLEAIVLSGCTVPVQMDTYTCDDDDAYSRLFMSFDTEDRKRTWQDSAKAFAAAHPVRGYEYTPRTLNEFRAGVEWHEREIVARRRKKAPTPSAEMRRVIGQRLRYSRFQRAIKYPRALAFYAKIQEVSVMPSVTKRSAVIAAMIATHMSGEVADRFWTEVATQEWRSQQLTSKTGMWPPYALHNKLRDCILKHSHVKGGRNLVTQFDVYAYCINAWNAYAKGKRSSSLKGSIRGSLPVAARPWVSVSRP
jgi:hypothetical protein